MNTQSEDVVDPRRTANERLIQDQAKVLRALRTLEMARIAAMLLGCKRSDDVLTRTECRAIDTLITAATRELLS